MMNRTAEPNVEQLITQARRGDTEALGRLLELFRHYLKLMARLQIDRQFQGKIDPSDLVQETFLESHRDFATFRGTTERQFVVWLRQVLVRNLVDRVPRYYGTQQRDVRLEQSLRDDVDRSSKMLGREFLAAESTPSEKAQQRETSVRLADALERLPAHYREVLMLRHLQQLSFGEVAKRMNRSVDSVDKIWVRALASLRSAMREQP